MKGLEFARNDVLETIKNNRVNHLIIYDDAMRGYRKALALCLRQMLEKIENEEEVETFINLEEPVSHKEEYDLVIQMISEALNESIELTEDKYKKYMLDKWPWSQHFSFNSSSYTSTSLSPTS